MCTKKGSNAQPYTQIPAAAATHEYWIFLYWYDLMCVFSLHWCIIYISAGFVVQIHEDLNIIIIVKKWHVLFVLVPPLIRQEKEFTHNFCLRFLLNILWISYWFSIRCDEEDARKFCWSSINLLKCLLSTKYTKTSCWHNWLVSFTSTFIWI